MFLQPLPTFTTQECLSQPGDILLKWLQVEKDIRKGSPSPHPHSRVSEGGEEPKSKSIN